MRTNRLRAALTHMGVMTGHPWAFGVLVAYFGFWLVTDRESFDIHAGATMITWAMTLFIQNAVNRDTQAIQAKLDELLRAHGEARNALIHIDEKPAEEIEALRDEARNDVSG